MANTTIICQGYTTSAFLSFEGYFSETKISHTSFSCEMKQNVLQSQAALAYADGVNTIHRTKGPFILDTPAISLTLSFELGPYLLSQIIKAIAKKRNVKITVKLDDKATNMSWEFSECYLTSFSFDVSENTVLSVSLGLFVRTDYIFYNWSKRTVWKGSEEALPIKNAEGMGASVSLTDATMTGLIPYYAWGIAFSGSSLQDVIGFSFSFSQEVIPKYECHGGKNKFANAASQILFGLPAIEFSTKQFKGGTASSVKYGNHSGGTENKSEAEEISSITSGQTETFKKTFTNDNIDVKLYGQKLMTLTGCEEISLTPSWDTFPMVEKTFLVNGTVTV